MLCADPIPSRYDYMDIGLYTGQFTPGYTVAVDVAGIQLFGDSIAEYTRRIDMCIDHHPPTQGMLTACCWTATPPPQPRSFTSC